MKMMLFTGENPVKKARLQCKKLIMFTNASHKTVEYLATSFFVSFHDVHLPKTLNDAPPCSATMCTLLYAWP